MRCTVLIKAIFVLSLLWAATLAFTIPILNLKTRTIQRANRILTKHAVGSTPLVSSSSSPLMTIEDAESRHGMPWKTSIVVNTDNEKDEESPSLLYMPFWEWQTSFIQQNLSNVRAIPCSDPDIHPHDYHYNENIPKKARIVNICLQSDEYRKIRMTYYDAGQKTQVFNSLWYPHPKYNLPVLGIDLLAFNSKKYLTIVDFQPIQEKECDHAYTNYEEKLQSIRMDYKHLQGHMSKRFYDETQFFSQQMIFGRFEEEHVVHEEVMPAFQRYVQTHFDMVCNTEPEGDLERMKGVLDRQAAYDVYSAERDPATKMFEAMFGTEWAEGFVHDFLFDQSKKECA